MSKWKNLMSRRSLEWLKQENYNKEINDIKSLLQNVLYVWTIYRHMVRKKKIFIGVTATRACQ